MRWREILCPCKIHLNSKKLVAGGIKCTKVSAGKISKRQSINTSKPAERQKACMTSGKRVASSAWRKEASLFSSFHNTAKGKISSHKYPKICQARRSSWVWLYQSGRKTHTKVQMLVIKSRLVINPRTVSGLLWFKLR